MIMYEKIDTLIETNKIPNIIFYGNYGVGKKHLLHYMIQKIYSNIKDKNEYILNVNCAHNKGIQFIRDEIIFFSKTNVIGHFKSIILTNIDKLTIDAQSALRRCIELYNHNTRFFVIVNDTTSIMKPILSRFSQIYVEGDNNYHKQYEKMFEKKNKKSIIWIKEHIDLGDIDFVNECYRNCISYDDFLDYIENTNIKNKYLFLFELNQWKSKIRNEKLLLLYGINNYRSFV